MNTESEWHVGQRCQVKTLMGTLRRAYIKSINYELEMAIVRVYGPGGQYTAEYRLESLRP